ncbi:MAG TPA: TspO/MBR family protein [Steroidobacteraceae bacterium]|nr:TspO/MBR family protein [Steroidobacteraceae bacterium]
MPMPPSRRAQRDLLSACAAAAAVMSALLLGQSAAFPNLTLWYAELLKPAFTPADWVFAPVWSALYLLMGISLWRILRLPDATPGRTRALVYSFVQLALNAAWSWLFFGLHSPLLGLIDIYPQLAFILLATAACARIDSAAGACLVPLAAWVAFASALNLAIWRLNG